MTNKKKLTKDELNQLRRRLMNKRSIIHSLVRVCSAVSTPEEELQLKRPTNKSPEKQHFLWHVESLINNIKTATDKGILLPKLITKLYAREVAASMQNGELWWPIQEVFRKNRSSKMTEENGMRLWCKFTDRANISLLYDGYVEAKADIVKAKKDIIKKTKHSMLSSYKKRYKKKREARIFGYEIALENNTLKKKHFQEFFKGSRKMTLNSIKNDLNDLGLWGLVEQCVENAKAHSK